MSLARVNRGWKVSAGVPALLLGGGVGGGAVLGPRGNAEAVLGPRSSTYSGTSALSFPEIPGKVLW